MQKEQEEEKLVVALPRTVSTSRLMIQMHVELGRLVSVREAPLDSEEVEWWFEEFSQLSLELHHVRVVLCKRSCSSSWSLQSPSPILRLMEFVVTLPWSRETLKIGLAVSLHLTFFIPGEAPSASAAARNTC